MGKMLQKSFGNLRWYEWLMLAGMILIGGYYMFTDITHPAWYLTINFISSVMGVCCIFLTAHASCGCSGGNAAGREDRTW